MSRWQKRSQEEKDKILADAREREKPASVKRDEHIEEQKKIHMELLSAHEIPLRCPDCGWVSSPHYTLIIDDDMMSNEKITWIRGACNKCGKVPILRPMHIKYMGLEGSMIITQLCMLLHSQGRLTDARPMKTIKCPWCGEKKENDTGMCTKCHRFPNRR